ncbi:GspH/FimT family pseudopilin [Dyella jiangningensis]|uniref:GspH/FimT family pseudopilin n=1 Tax=Dyella jiangningensis TaxID=1379159 RepID=UPI00240EAD2D|nr:GspH/FimT family pseudopilin [Dyella jiangningensis]MDG2537283.1 GspH/FimT family pseudopilin [Dyella jiangningensis]
MKSRRQRGMSLIELLVVVSVLAILAAIGVPSYQQWVRNSRIRTAAESLQNGLRIARSEAAQRGSNVRFELTSATNASWEVCALNGGSTCEDAGATTITSYVASEGATGIELGVANAQGTLTTPLSLGIPANSGITFGSLGRPTSYGAKDLARIDVSSGVANDRSLITTISSGGMVRMCDPRLNTDTSPQGCTKL